MMCVYLYETCFPFTLTVAVVGLDRTKYMVTETVGLIEVCAIVYDPLIECPIAFPFEVTLSTIDDTACIIL